MKKKRLTISERMQRVKSRNTRLEKSFSSLLRENEIAYSIHPRVFGHPDFRIKGTKILVFCDSAFWHGRREKEITGEAFKKNRDFWVKKLQYNKTRDAKIGRALRRQGWQVLRFWDDDVLKRPSFVVSKLHRYVKNRKHEI